MNKKKIKVVKKKDLDFDRGPETAPRQTAKESATKVVSNVSSWVNEFQRRKRDETKKAFDTFLASQPESI